MESVYIHIPFCKNICSYCDFCKIFYNNKDAKRYLKSLLNEVKEYYLGEEIKTIYIGGGTPSSLNKEELISLFEIINIFNLSKENEFTFECNPEDITEELIIFLKENKVNRLSIGIQSFNENKLNFMERKASFKDLKHKINLIREIGINNINLDLMYGIPKETIKILKTDLKKILKLKPEHISTYSLIIEENTKIKIKGNTNIEEELELEMYNYIRKKLNKKGYVQYEISNFSKREYQSKHNLVYWNNKEYYGFGLGASGYINGFRYENTKNTNKYCNGEYKKEEYLLSKQDIMENEIMLGLRKTNGINLIEFYNKYNVNIQEVFPIKPLLKTKELIYKDGNLFINPKKTYISNEILLKLI